MVEVTNLDLNYSRCKAVAVFLLYAVQQDQCGQHQVLHTFLHTARSLQWLRHIWSWINPLVTVLLKKESPAPLKQAAILVAPHLPWQGPSNKQHLIQPWATAASEVTYTNEVCQSVVNTLLQVAFNDSLQPHIPASTWKWLNKLPLLPPLCVGRYWGSAPGVVQAVRALGDIKTLKSYLFLVWSEWDCLRSEQDYLHQEILPDMCALIKEDLSGIGMGHERKDLLQHLDHILKQLELGLDHLQQHKPSLDEYTIQQMKKQYGKLKEVLLEVDRESIDKLICEPLKSAILFSLLSSVQVQGATQHLHVQFLSYSWIPHIPTTSLSISCLTLVFPYANYNMCSHSLSASLNAWTIAV